MGTRLTESAHAAVGHWPNPQPIGVILAGGSGTRLGGVAKGLIEIGGLRMIDRVAAALRPCVESIVLSANASDAETWLPGTRVIRDVLAGGGSAAGIHAALHEFGRAIAVVAWDMPFVTSDTIRAIVAAAGERIDAVVPDGTERNALQPLCGWYAPSCADIIEQQWDAGDRSLHAVLRRARTVVIPTSVFAEIGVPERLFFNVNSPDDVAHATQLATDDAGRRSG